MSFDLVTDPEIISGYLTDASNVQGHAGALVRPRTTAEVCEVVRQCQLYGTPLTVCAQRTSTTAAPVPFGGWLLSMEHLTRVRSVSQDTATAEGGVILGEFQREIEERGRFFPPDPTSRHECSLGAAISCNASGARSFRYGPMRRWVESLEVVLPNGELSTVARGEPYPADWPKVLWRQPPVKTAAGYCGDSHLDAFIGQEGTLGIIVAATVRLVDPPRGIFGLLVYFPHRRAAVAFMEQARHSARENPNGALSPRCLEYLDQYCLNLARHSVGDVPDGARAALFCEQELESIGIDEHLAAWWEALSESEALVDDTVVATDSPGLAKLHEFRHAIPVGINEQIVDNQVSKVGTDLAVPDSALNEMMTAYEKSPLPHVLFGHIGDNHLHLNLLPEDGAQFAQAREYCTKLVHRALALGGTVSGEHGIGKLKKMYLAKMAGEETIQQFRALKAHLDPKCVLGRGVMFDAEL
ncbi:MAG: FAD-binding oxidoreductase [Proteobacteria bacterium]|jgi:D-lactate dehydrogenase (cytochrome)|nr:FAD-binding oxidoreductase [Pseudomonadota bacterium]